MFVFQLQLCLPSGGWGHCVHGINDALPSCWSRYPLKLKAISDISDIRDIRPSSSWVMHGRLLNIALWIHKAVASILPGACNLPQ
ncbi:hypothetical protein CY34DRAFT_800905 [Suillus luteus UH-Slu-Lm8-n1]|uniref:Uncharacterized protein n=1 Tax=Suillus luteus UH-Slu-Lm8-n1 TaxID=930992 RepID=A0A0D0A7H5_9AGAM|nr:hypothetical protein CY34DRAFT_800905 [Suillus luteus UH-Slu-Lm8-n1]